MNGIYYPQTAQVNADKDKKTGRCSRCILLLFWETLNKSIQDLSEYGKQKLRFLFSSQNQCLIGIDFDDTSLYRRNL